MFQIFIMCLVEKMNIYIYIYRERERERGKIDDKKCDLYIFIVIP